MSRHRGLQTGAIALGLLASLLGTAQQPAGTPEAVAGQVVSARGGHPIAHALVSLEDVVSNRTIASAGAADDGSFRFGPVPSGKYRLVGQAAGFLEAAYLQHEQLSTAIVTGAGLPVSHLVLSLVPQATITGRVLDEAGDPVPHASLTLFRQDMAEGRVAVHPVNSTVVDDDGSFEFSPLQPGQFFLAASGVPWYAVHPPPEPDADGQGIRPSVDPRLDVAYPTLFYPSARSSDAAAPISLNGGDTFVANLQMVPEHAVSLIVRRPPASGPDDRAGLVQQIPQLSQTIFGTQRMMLGSVSEVMGHPDQVIVQGIAPGRYDVQIQQFSPGAQRPTARAGTVDLTGGSVTMDAGEPPALATVSVSVTTSDGSPLPRNTRIRLLSTERTFDRQTAAEALVDATGRAEISDVAPGDFRLAATGGGHVLQVAGLSVVGPPATARQVHVNAGAHMAVAVTLAQGSVTLKGVVQREGKPAAAELVVLVPAGADAAPELFRRDQSDLDGSFLLPEVPPGKYLLLALHDGWNLPWSDLHAMMPYLLQAEPVTVSAGAHGTVRLPAPLASQPVR